MRLLLLAWLSLAIPVRSATGANPPGLDVVVLPTIQYAFGDIWAKTPAARGPSYQAVGQVVRGQRVHILVHATNWTLGPDQIAEVSYKISFIRPDGTTGNAKEGLRLIPRGPAKEPRSVRMATEMVVFIADPNDPLGLWRVVVEATDLVGAVTVHREQSFTVVGNEVLELPLPVETDQSRWFMGYHKKPMPHQLLGAVRLMAENPPAGAKPRRDAENGTWLGFFEQILADNPWLMSHVITRLDSARGREREFLATLLAYAKRDEPAFYQTLPDAAREAFLLRHLETWPVPTKNPLDGDQLDVLWGRFFASGRYEPIRELVAVLSYLPHKDTLVEYKKLKKKPAQLPVEVTQSIIFGVATWSLRSNIEQDKVVRDYCEGILLRKELPAAEHDCLAAIFKVAVENLNKAKGAKPVSPKPE